MIVSAFAKRLRKNPPPDEDILASLLWIERMITAVRGESEIADLPTADALDEASAITSVDIATALGDDAAPIDDDELTRPETDSLIPAHW